MKPIKNRKKQKLRFCALAAAILFGVMSLNLFAAELDIAGQNVVDAAGTGGEVTLTVPADAAGFSFDLALGRAGDDFSAVAYTLEYDADAVALDDVVWNSGFPGTKARYSVTAQAGNGAVAERTSIVNGYNVLRVSDDGKTVISTVRFAFRGGATGAGSASARATQIRLYDFCLIRVYPAEGRDYRTLTDRNFAARTINVTQKTVGPGDGTDTDAGGDGPGGPGDNGPGETDNGGPGPGETDNSGPGANGPGTAGPGSSGPGSSGSAPPAGSPAGGTGANGAAGNGQTGADTKSAGAGTAFEDEQAPLGYGLVFDNPFTDVLESDWFFGDVEFVYTRGFFKGTGETEFSPNLPVSRGMIVTVLGRLHGVRTARYPDSSFGDVPSDSYYAPYIEWARENGVVLGIGENLFAPDRTLSREEMTAIFSRYLSFTENELPMTREDTIFSDESQIEVYAREPIHQFYRVGLVNGKDGGRFDPQGSATRAESAAILRRLANAIGVG
ncbi:MAG: S-layer homology domain-containing protein [Clostridiales bacterium]|jgi:hypothetical protein|nr:S-layer homology domain-containing protein [Clostridiales bacterium]